MGLDELDRLEKAATPGPLSVQETLSSSVAGFVDIADADCNLIASMFIRTGPNAKHVEDANVLVGARNALPKLLAVAKAAAELRTATHNFYIARAEEKPNAVVRELWDVAYQAGEALDAALAEMEKA
jgi:hypothetical protein